MPSRPQCLDAAALLRLRARIHELARQLGRLEPMRLGVLIEVPWAALLADQLARYADFLSIGADDLTRYTLAIDRQHTDFAARADSLHPAVLRLIAATVQGAARYHRWVGVCGALASDLEAMPLLVGLGVRALSADSPAIEALKARVRALDYGFCRQRARDALSLESAQAVRALSCSAWPLA